MLRGYENGADVNGGLTFPVAFPGTISKPQTVTLASSALANGIFDILQNVKFYLTGDPGDITTVQGSWPNLGFSYNPQRPQLNGGFQISFDGINWTTFSIRNPALAGSVGSGDRNDPSTWILLPGSAIGSDGQDGTPGPYDQATFYIRFVVPPTATLFPDQVPSWPRNIICPARGRAAPGGKPAPAKRPGTPRSCCQVHTAAFIVPDPGTLEAASSISRGEARAVLLLLLMLK